MNGEPDHLLTAPQVARHCGVDLKTIHNWVHAGQIDSFRTPGRHLRFQPEGVVRFLEEYGYPVPSELQKYLRRVVMIIDPDVASLRQLTEDLEPQHEIKSYECPVKALLAIEREQPDLIVSDVELPGIDGYNLVERLSKSIREDPQRCRPVIVYSSGGDEDNCLRAGAAAFVVKPNIRSLCRLVSRLLEEQRES
jgi:excisionase family DNA binding protein